MSEKNNLLPKLIFLALVLMWGSSFILVKRGLEAFGALEVGALRIVTAGIALMPLALARLKRLERKHWRFIIVIGLIGSLIPSFLFSFAQLGIDSSLAGILNAVTPFFVVIIGAVFFNRKVGVRVGVGLIIGFIGCIVLLLGGDKGFGSFNWYALPIILATVCYGLNLNIIKTFMADVSAVALTSISLLVVLPAGIIILLVGTDFITIMTQHPKAWESFGYVVLLGIMSTSIALILYNRLVQLTNPIFTSSVTYFIPVIALMWGILDGESLSLYQYFGMVTIIFGVYLSNRTRKTKGILTEK